MHAQCIQWLPPRTACLHLSSLHHHPLPSSSAVPRLTLGDSEQPHDGLALAYISHMLMDEDIIVDKFFYQYPDHPVLLQAEQPFAEILSAPHANSSDSQDSSAFLPGHGSHAGNGIMVSGFLSGEVHNPAFFLNGKVTAEEPSSSTSMGMLSSMAFLTGMEEANRFLPTHDGLISSTSMGMLSSMAFLKGMEEANRFLPTHNGLIDGRGCKDKFGDMDGETVASVGRSSKQIGVLGHNDLEDEGATLEMTGLLILEGHHMYPNPSESICRKAAPRVKRSVWQMTVAELETLLMRCADAVAASDRRKAGDLLKQIKRHSLPTGDATQRLAHYFAEGLEARLAGTGRQLYHSITVAKRTSIMEILKDYHLYMANFCFLKVSIHFSNKNIYNAVAGRKKLHIVHYGINDGFQWPELLRWLADREGGPPEVRITGITSPQPGLCPDKQAEETRCRLSHCASQLGVPFKFCAIIAKSEVVRAEDLDIDPDEVLVVNNLFHFRTLMDESLTFDTLNPRDMVLRAVRKMRPSMFVHATVNGSYSSAFFKTRFRQALHNFTAQFDMMETTMPWDNGKRLLVERDIFARCAMNTIACEGADRVERSQNYKEWQAQNRRAGLRQLHLDPDIVEILKDQVKEQYHKHFLISQDGQWLLLGWKGRVLYALSTWAADDATGSQPAYR